MRLRPELRSVYSSHTMTALHANCEAKQRAPAVCLLRQILKAHGRVLRSRIRSAGYHASTGKKCVQREYVVA